MTVVNAQQIGRTWDCAWPFCPGEARTPGGHCHRHDSPPPPADTPPPTLEPGSLAHLIPDSERDAADRVYAARAAAARPAAQQRRRRQPWTREQVIDAIRRWAAEHGAPPISKDWQHWSPDRPTHDVARARCGSWADAIEAAGYPRPAPGPAPRQERP